MTGTSYSQSLSVSSPSFDFWGAATNIYSISLSGNNAGVHYFYYSGDLYSEFEGVNNQSMSKHNFGMSYSPFKIGDSSLGLIYTSNPFPTMYSLRLNFIIDLAVKVKDIAVSYVHISNGFGVRHHQNKGYDAISVKYIF